MSSSKKQKIEERKNHAVVCRGPGDYRFVADYPAPVCQGDDIIARVLLGGICAGDAKCHGGAEMFWGTSDKKGYCEPPVVPGHEFVCEIAQLGDRYTGPLQVGDRIVAEQLVPCGACRFCQRPGQYHMCMPHRIFGFKNGLDGSWQAYMRVPASAHVYKLPGSLSIKAGVYVEPLSCAIHAVNRGSVKPEDVVVVSGAGALGLGMICYLKSQKKPRLIIALDMNDHRLAVAKQCGADKTFNVAGAHHKVGDEVRALTDGYGADVVIECAGHPSSVVAGLDMIAKLGRFVEFSVFSQPTKVDWTVIGDTKELSIFGAHLSPRPCYDQAIELLSSGCVPVDKIVTDILDLKDFEKGIRMVNDSSSKSIKVVLKP